MVSAMNGRLRKFARTLALVADLTPGAALAVLGAVLIGTGLAWM